MEIGTIKAEVKASTKSSNTLLNPVKHVNYEPNAPKTKAAG